MTPLPVFVPPDVRAQVRAIVLHIASDSGPNALAWESRLTATLDRLGEFHGHALDEKASRGLGEPIRKTVFEGTYLVHYQVDTGRAVVVVNVRHGARQPRAGEP